MQDQLPKPKPIVPSKLFPSAFQQNQPAFTYKNNNIGDFFDSSNWRDIYENTGRYITRVQPINVVNEVMGFPYWGEDKNGEYGWQRPNPMPEAGEIRPENYADPFGKDRNSMVTEMPWEFINVKTKEQMAWAMDRVNSVKKAYTGIAMADNNVAQSIQGLSQFLDYALIAELAVGAAPIALGTGAMRQRLLRAKARPKMAETFSFNNNQPFGPLVSVFGTGGLYGLSQAAVTAYDPEQDIDSVFWTFGLMGAYGGFARNWNARKLNGDAPRWASPLYNNETGKVEWWRIHDEDNADPNKVFNADELYGLQQEAMNRFGNDDRKIGEFIKNEAKLRAKQLNEQAYKERWIWGWAAQRTKQFLADRYGMKLSGGSNGRTPPPRQDPMEVARRAQEQRRRENDARAFNYPLDFDGLRNLEQTADSGINSFYNPMTPLRLLDHGTPEVREAVEKSINIGSFQKKNLVGLPSEQSVEARIQSLHVGTFFESLDGFQNAFFSMRGIKVGDGLFDSTINKIKTGIEDRSRNPAGMTYSAFSDQVDAAMRLGDRHHIPEVQEAAQHLRKVYARVAELANELPDRNNPFYRPIILQMEDLQEKMLRERQSNPQADIDEIQAELTDLQQKLANRKANMGKPGYLPVIYNHEKINADKAGFVDDVAAKLNLYEGVPLDEARTIATDAMNRILKEDVSTIGEVSEYSSRVTRDRLFNSIPSYDLRDWIQTDALELTRYYSRQVSADIELARMFGSPDFDDMYAPIEQAMLRDGLDEVAIANAKEDLSAIHELLRGVYGLPEDPSAVTSRFIRYAKTATNVALLGKAAITGLSDYFTPTALLGLEETMGPLLDAIQSENFRALIKKGIAEARAAGQALDMENNMVALMLSNSGDVHGRFSKFDRNLDQVEQMYFTFGNFLAPHTVMAKGWASLLIGHNMKNWLDDVVLNGAENLSERSKAILMQSGIGYEDAALLKSMMNEFGEFVDGIFVPNTALWSGEGAEKARRIYRAALTKEVDIAVVTPGKGDKPLWMNEEVGGLISMYMGFAFASTERVLKSGLQMRDGTAISGLIGLLAAGLIANEISKIIAGDDSEESSMSMLFNAFDRSGAGGIFAHGNNMLERGLGFGMRSFWENVPPASAGDAITTGLGPIGSMAAATGDMLFGAMSGNDQMFESGARVVAPASNTLWMEAATSALGK